jgi:hypothetical protein
MGGSDMRVTKICALICALGGVATSSAAFAQTSDSMSHSKMMMHHHTMMHSHHTMMMHSHHTMMMHHKKMMDHKMSHNGSM